MGPLEKAFIMFPKSWIFLEVYGIFGNNDLLFFYLKFIFELKMLANKRMFVLTALLSKYTTSAILKL